MENFNPNFSTLAPEFTNSPAKSGTLIVDPPGVVEVFKELVLDIAEKEEEDFYSEARFKEDLGLDSLDMVELVMYCEKEFAISMKDHEWQSLKKIGEFIELIEKKKGLN